MHRIIHGECLAMMAKIPDRSIDFVCADFPYNISGKGGVTMRGDRVVAADFGEWDKFPSEEAYGASIWVRRAAAIGMGCGGR